jgi:hypothetical protein
MQRRRPTRGESSRERARRSRGAGALAREGSREGSGWRSIRWLAADASLAWLALHPAMAGTNRTAEPARDSSFGIEQRPQRLHLRRQRGLTLFLVTHDTTIARRAERLGVMTDGRRTMRRHSPARQGVAPKELFAAAIRESEMRNA